MPVPAPKVRSRMMMGLAIASAEPVSGVPASSAAPRTEPLSGVGDGEGEALGLGVGVGEAEGLGEGLGLGEGVGEAVGVGVGVGVGDAVGVGVGVSLAWTAAAAPTSPVLSSATAVEANAPVINADAKINASPRFCTYHLTITCYAPAPILPRPMVVD